MSEGSNGVSDVMYFLSNRDGKNSRRNEIEDADLQLSREFNSELHTVDVQMNLMNLHV